MVLVALLGVFGSLVITVGDRFRKKQLPDAEAEPKATVIIAGRPLWHYLLGVVLAGSTSALVTVLVLFLIDQF